MPGPVILMQIESLELHSVSLIEQAGRERQRAEGFLRMIRGDIGLVSRTSDRELSVARPFALGSAGNVERVSGLFLLLEI